MADERSARGQIAWIWPPDDSRLPGVMKRIRKTTGKERAHRDRGNASDTERWRKHKGQCRD